MAENSLNSMRLVAETSSFIRCFEEKISSKQSPQNAYEATERDHERLTGRRKYHDYSSFSVVRSRKKRKKG